jgi:antitoxin CcdA
MTQTTGSGIDDAIRAAGGVERLGNALGCAHSSVVRWRQRGRVPADRVVAIEAVTGVPRHRLRPELYALPDQPGMAETQAPYLAEARSQGVDPQHIPEAALTKAAGDEKARRWVEENREAIESYNAWVEEHGVILAKYRTF